MARSNIASLKSTQWSSRRDKSSVASWRDPRQPGCESAQLRFLPTWRQMAYDEKTAERVRALLSDQSDVLERKMMGGLCFSRATSAQCGAAQVPNQLFGMVTLIRKTTRSACAANSTTNGVVGLVTLNMNLRREFHTSELALMRPSRFAMLGGSYANATAREPRSFCRPSPLGHRHPRRWCHPTYHRS